MRFLKKPLLAIIVLFLFLSDIDLSFSQEPDSHAVFNVSGKKKLYIEGDIFYSSRDINDFLRIADIQKDKVVLNDYRGRKRFILKPGDKVPFADFNVIFVKSIRLDQLEKTAKNREGTKKIGLDAELFEKIGIQKSGRDKWVVDKKSARKAFRSIGKELFSIVRQIEPRYKFKEGPSLKVDSELGCVVLERRGFLILNIAVKHVADKAGLREGDLIKRINGCDVNTIIGLYRAYKNVRRNYKMVNVDIVRNGKNKTLVYKIES